MNVQNYQANGFLYLRCDADFVRYDIMRKVRKSECFSKKKASGIDDSVTMRNMRMSLPKVNTI